MSPRALADAQQVRPQTMQQTLDALERRGLARRADHPTDRRQILISLTPKGRARAGRGAGRRQAWLVKELHGPVAARAEDGRLGRSTFWNAFFNHPTNRNPNESSST